ncbi:uncharacterized protein LOC120354882 [Nilaparvata lugens]|uniref:uncharacterized protein LOC120354882 n=1 Tax=Nilaparvata lugens TaxID=108931 RepID=UPI00193EB28A|nr:uncharacterized protein LOC120354882 [Nilaparvata lugens]
MMGNRAYFANQRIFKSRIVSRATKVKMYKTLVRPVVTYGAETWTLLSERALKSFERKMYRRIWGPLCDGGVWRTRHNSQIDEAIGEGNIVRFIKARRMEWLGHVVRMNMERTQLRLNDGDEKERKTENEMDK